MAEISPERDLIVHRKRQMPNKESFGIKLNNVKQAINSKKSQTKDSKTPFDSMTLTGSFLQLSIS